MFNGKNTEHNSKPDDILKDAVSLRPDVYVYAEYNVNVTFIGKLGQTGYVMINTGSPGYSAEIIEKAKDLFGKESKPKALILTQGELTQSGNTLEFVKEFEMPVYAHPREFPYLSGEKEYPTHSEERYSEEKEVVESTPFDVGENLHALPPHGEVPYLTGFQWISVPGSTSGQVALFRAEDRLLITGGALSASLKKDTGKGFAKQEIIFRGPQTRTRAESERAKEAIVTLKELQPEYIIPGYGVPVEGDDLQERLTTLVETWDTSH